MEIVNHGNTVIDLTGYYVPDAAGNIIEFDQDHLIGFTTNSDSMQIIPEQRESLQ